MSRSPAANRVPNKDMYWFAHGGMESNDKCLNQRSTTPGECEEEVNDATSPTLRSLPDRRGLVDDQKSPYYLNTVVDSGNSSGPSSLEMKDDRARNLDKRIAVEERRKQLLEAEQERNDAVLRKHMEREAALEARRNAQRSNISFAFGSSVPRNVESLQGGGDSDKVNRHSNASGLLQKGDDIMSKSMTAAVPAPRGRRKNDLMPTVPYDRTSAPKSTSTCSTRKRSVSMTRLDQLAQPRRHYVEANKANSTTSSGASSMLKDTIKSPTRPLSSASEQSGGSGRLGSSATRRVRSSPRKPRPVSIAGTVPDSKTHEIKISPVKKTFLASKKPQTEAKKASPVTGKSSSAKLSEKYKPIEKAKPAPRPASTPKPSKQATTKQPSLPKTSSPKAPTAKKAVTNKKKADIMVSSQQPSEVTANQLQDVTKSPTSPPASPPPDNAATEAERNNAKRIISEEEAKAALAEKRRLAREQAEKEAELERQRQEELRIQEEERLRVEEEEQKKMEEEQLRLLEEHRKQEEEKLRKAIEENERKEEEERVKREEEQRFKAEQERKAQEEAEKQRIELEEKLRKEEEERAERKKRLEKIMSRTRGKSSNTSPSGSVSGSEQLDSSENQQENLSSGANSLDSNATGEIGSGPASLECHQGKSEPLSDGTSLEANPTYDVASDNESLNDIVMPRSETASQDNSLVIIPEKDDLKPFSVDSVGESQPTAAVLLESEVPEFQAENIVSSTDLEIKEETKLSFAEEIQQLEEIKVQPGEKDLNELNEGISQVIDVPIESEKMVEDSPDLKIDEEKNEVVEQFIVPVSSEVTLLETTPIVSASHDSEAAVINQAEVILSFEEDIRNFEDASISGSDVTSTLLPDVPQSSESYSSEQAGPEETEMEQNSHFSTSSDIKLPDPIYETSDEGSVSSEKHQHDEEPHQESQTILDEVFNEKEVVYSEETNFNPFEKHDIENPASHLMAAYESQFDIGGMQDSIYAYETSDAVPGIIEQPREIGEENVYPTRSSTSSVPETREDLLNAKANIDVFPDEEEENKENIGGQMSHQTNPFATVECGNEYDIYADKENMQFSSPDNMIPEDISMFKSDMLPEQFNLEINQIQSQDNSSNNTFLLQESSVCEQNFENQSILNKSPTIPSASLGFSDVTLIKATDSNECIGIISSVDHDHVSNDLVQQSVQNEQLKSNFEYCSITDSEESSLDSNLSQVMTVEVSENNSVGLNNVENISLESTLVPNNVQAENPFKESAVNGSSDSKANGDHYSETEVLSNGHRIEASDPKLEQIGDYVQLDGKHISSVDHSKTNIFDNVDAVDFGKMSPEPFLAKGSSNQISGNPFLLQDDQKQVLMTPDFFN